MNARLKVRLLKQPTPRPSAPIGEAAMENAARAAYQSAHTKDGQVAPLPLTLAEAWLEAQGREYARLETLDGRYPSDDLHWSRA